MFHASPLVVLVLLVLAVTTLVESYALYQMDKRLQARRPTVDKPAAGLRAQITTLGITNVCIAVDATDKTIAQLHDGLMAFSPGSIDAVKSAYETGSVDTARHAWQPIWTYQELSNNYNDDGIRKYGFFMKWPNQDTTVYYVSFSCAEGKITVQHGAYAPKHNRRKDNPRDVHMIRDTDVAELLNGLIHHYEEEALVH